MWSNENERQAQDASFLPPFSLFLFQDIFLFQMKLQQYNKQGCEEKKKKKEMRGESDNVEENIFG